MAELTRANGRRIRKVGKGDRYTQMAAFIKVITKITCLMARGHIYKVNRSLKGSGNRVKSMGMGLKNMPTAAFMKEIGRIIYSTAKESSKVQMVTLMWESGGMA